MRMYANPPSRPGRKSEIKQYGQLAHRPEVATSSHRLTIGILASGRHNHELTQLIGHLSNYLTDNFRLVICNVEYSSIARPQEVTHFEQFLEQSDCKGGAGLLEVFEPDCQMGSDYVLLLEDDALPVPEFNTAINSIMRQLDKIKQVDYVKLFHPWRLRGIPSLFQTAVVVIFIAYFLQLLIWRDRKLFVILLVTISGHIVVRIYLLMFSSLLLSLPNCQKQSHAALKQLFSEFKINEMVTDLGSEEAALKHAKDHILDESRFEGRATDANFVVHIGYYSYLRKKKVRTGKYLPVEYQESPTGLPSNPQWCYHCPKVVGLW
uniref:Uncharacterized protein n=1 Tax=Ditylenchus dipsaci TaxID=166011 RepID=A0A915D7Q3_9BILA